MRVELSSRKYCKNLAVLASRELKLINNYKISMMNDLMNKSVLFLLVLFIKN